MVYARARMDQSNAMGCVALDGDLHVLYSGVLFVGCRGVIAAGVGAGETGSHSHPFGNVLAGLWRIRGRGVLVWGRGGVIFYLLYFQRDQMPVVHGLRLGVRFGKFG